MRRLAWVLLLGIAGCTPTVYEAAEPVAFQSTVPRSILFDVLAREAMSMGYNMEYADPMSTTFQVHSRELGQRTRRGRRNRPERSRVVRGNLFTVEVTDGAVRVSALGRHVRPDGTMHPRLAAELTLFGGAMRDRAQVFGASFVSVPAPPAGYGVVPPGYGTPQQPMQPTPVITVQPGAPPPVQPQPQPQVSPGQGLAAPR